MRCLSLFLGVVIALLLDRVSAFGWSELPAPVACPVVLAEAEPAGGLRSLPAEEVIEKLDLTRPGLAAARRARDAGDRSGALRALLAYYRNKFPLPELRAKADPAGFAEAKTGKELWRPRLGGNYSASPIYAASRLYFSTKPARPPSSNRPLPTTSSPPTTSTTASWPPRPCPPPPSPSAPKRRSITLRSGHDEGRGLHRRAPCGSPRRSPRPPERGLCSTRELGPPATSTALPGVTGRCGEAACPPLRKKTY
jgi:hypothetical protein